MICIHGEIKFTRSWDKEFILIMPRSRMAIINKKRIDYRWAMTYFETHLEMDHDLQKQRLEK